MDPYTGKVCAVCRSSVNDLENSCSACEEGKATMREEDPPINPDPFGFLGSFGPSQSERAADEGWELDEEEEIPY